MKTQSLNTQSLNTQFLNTQSLKTQFLMTLCGLAAASGVAHAELIAGDDFDTPFNLVNYSAIDAEGNDPTNTGVWSSSSDNFGPRSVGDFTGTSGTGNFVSDTVIDWSNDGNPGDGGIITTDYPGSFFAIVDTDNGVNPSGVVTGTWVFDISSAQSLTSFSVDLAAIGGWFDNGSVFQQFTFRYSIDGNTETDLFTFRADNGAGGVTYNFADGGSQMLSGGISGDGNPLALDGTPVTNQLTTFTAPLSGSGSQLTLELSGFVNGNDAGIVFDNIEIDGVIPAPGVASAFAVVLVMGGRRRRA